MTELKKIERASRLLRLKNQEGQQLGSRPKFLPEEHRRLFLLFTFPLFAIVPLDLVSQTAAVG